MLSTRHINSNGMTYSGTTLSGYLFSADMFVSLAKHLITSLR